MMQKQTQIYSAIVLLQAFIFGFSNAVTKIGYESLTPFWALFLRFSPAFFIFAVISGRGFLKEIKKAPVSAWIPSALSFGGTYILMNCALNLTTATNVGFLVSLSIVFVPILERLILGKPYKLKYLPAQLLIVVGLYLLCGGGSDFCFGLGEALGLLSSVSMAGSLVFGKKGLGSLKVSTLSAVQMGTTALFSLVGALALESEFQITQVTFKSWMVLFFLLAFSTCFASWLQNKALTKISSAQVSLILCSEPIFTAAVAFVLLGEKLDLTGLIGASVIVCCIAAENYIIDKSYSGFMPDRNTAEALAQGRVQNHYDETKRNAPECENPRIG